jgi:hypothetical protein
LSFVYAEHFQPGVVLFGNMPDKVSRLNVTLLPISFGDIDQTRALRSKHIHMEAQSLSLSSIIVQAELTQGYATTTHR